MDRKIPEALFEKHNNKILKSLNIFEIIVYLLLQV